MLSTISSFLPSALSDKLEKLESHSAPSRTDQTDDEEGVKTRDMAHEGHDNFKKEKKKRSTSNETFIVVRPPPAKNNHPLNLQLQLVPAQHTRDRSSASAATTPTNSRFSADYTQTNESAPAAVQPPSPSLSSEMDHGLQRSPSMRSNRSETSAFYASASSAGSVTSFASTASNASGRRMIIPLYNLCAHNVMTNTILDAGTDAKVAKFHKRGIEIIGLAVLEPTEVWNGPTTTDLQRTISSNSLAPPGQGGSRAATPDTSQHSPVSSRLSLSSDHSGHIPHPADPGAPPSASPQPAGAKKIFGRIFRKKEASGGGGGGGHTPTSSISVVTAVVEPPTPDPEVRAPTMQPPPPRPEILLSPVLGLSPTAAHPPSGRCVAHVWTVRRWLKTDSQSLISGVIGKISREVSSHGYGSSPEMLEWEVRFEWARGRPKGEKPRKLARSASFDVNGDKNSRTPSRRNSALLEAEKPRDASPRQSLDVVPERSLSARAPSPQRSAVTAAAKGTSVASTQPSDEEAGEDPGDESDPEDSETPWTCTLVVTHPSHPIAQLAPGILSSKHRRTRSVSSTVGSAAPGPSPSDGPLRLKVATLAPAPHHPKVVCQLKVPFPLPDVEVEHGMIRKRLMLPDGSTRSTVPRERPGLIVTAEELKDVICSTAFWVVVRQGFGGLGKKNRKGDGWKIRG